ncbi:O-antigen ligase family protein [Candidatus Uhrbacteria bacterium]|nr:O-antigen ligase family protein [Candidatus Uhrbacteria bacterium]
MTLRDKLSLLLVRLIRSGLFAIPLLPFVVVPYLPSFNTGQHFVFRLLVDVLWIGWLLLCALDARYRPCWTRYTVALLFFLGAVTLADSVGVNPYRSIWSTLPRMDGLIDLLHIGAYALVLRNLLRTREDWRLFFGISTVVAAIVASVSIAQRVGFFPWMILGESRTATIGNTTFFSGYLLFHIFFALVLALYAQRRWQQWGWRATPILFVVAIFLASTRAVLLALGLTGIIVVLYAVGKKRHVMHRMARITIVSCVLFFFFVVPSLLVALRGVPVMSSYRPLAHWIQDDAPLGTRPILWEMAWKGFLERPFFGWGQENYLAVYHRYYDSRLTQFGEYWSDHPHTILLEWLVSAGMLGLLAYAGLFFSAYRNGRLALRSRVIARGEVLIFGTALFTYVVQNLFVFDTLLTSMLFFSILAYLDGAGESFSDEQMRSTSKVSSVVFGVSAVVFVLFFIATFEIFYTRPLTAAYYFDRMRTYALPSRVPIETIQDIAEKALRFETFVGTHIREEILVQLTGTLARQYGDTHPSFLRFVAFAMREGEKEAARFALPDARIFYFLGDVERAASATDPSLLPKAKVTLTKAIRLSPTNQRFWFALARVYMLERKPEAAIAMMENESLRTPLAVSDLKQLADAYSLAGRYESLATLSRLMILRDPLQPNHYRRLWFAYIRQGKEAQARTLATHLLQLHSDWPPALFSLP